MPEEAPVTLALSERVNAPVSTRELERRWAAVRSAMEREGVDVLLMQSNNEQDSGYVRYVTDVPAGNHGTTVVFPLDDAMTLVTHGPFGGRQELPPEGDGVLRGVRRVLTAPSFQSVAYTRAYDADLALSALEEYRGAVVGLVGTAQMSLALGERVRAGLPRASFVEASDLVDRVKAVKSAEEQDLIRRTARLQDAAMEAAGRAIEPGRRESEVAAAVWQASQTHGSEAGIVMVGSAPPGEAWTIAPRHLQNRVIHAGDAVAVLVEVNGPGGLYAELGRTFIVGRVPERLSEELEFVLRAQRFTLDLLRPGASCPEVWEAYNAFLRDHGRPEEKRVHCHGQGTDLVERPLVRFDETMAIGEGMHLACHPNYVRDGSWSWICDNYFVGPGGPGTRLHTFPQRIVEL